MKSRFLLQTSLCILFFVSTSRQEPQVDNVSSSSETIKQLEQKRTVDDVEWTEWSAWSPCSRSCDGGVTLQIRKCNRKNGCAGESTKHRICNMQPCMEPGDFRAAQCSAYNSKPYRGRLYTWDPYYDPEDPCSLTCQAQSYKFVAKLAPRVQDGTRCRDGSLDMCVAGKCMTVGCDLQLGSTKKVDDCGLCGGNGSSCKKPAYHWVEAQFSLCSVTCGGGYQMSRPVCVNNETGKEMNERLCDVAKRPRPQIRECNTQKCPAGWITESWAACSASCGGGKQSRQVYCAQGGTNGTRIKISSIHCPRHRPVSERPCNIHSCPRWFNGPWSGCSVTCGVGHQTRAVFCHDARGHRTGGCDKSTMPATKQSCETGITCFDDEDNSEMIKGSQEDAPPDPLPWSQRIVGSPPVATEPSFVPGEWGPCSVSCDKGFRKRTVECKIFLEFSKTVAKLPSRECTGPRPPEIETCYARPCALDQNRQEENAIPGGQVGIEVTYSWRSAGFSPCSASCLGGTRESLIHCVRDHDQAIVSQYLCDIRKKPREITRTCNDHACPPRWNVSEFTPCSKPCGGGTQKREVQCLHEVTRGAANTLIVPNNHCPSPPPRSEQFCNIFECPIRWKTEQWSKCSKSCGGGIKTRKIKCQKELAFGQVHEQSPSRCPKKRPKTEKICNTKQCPNDVKPEIYASQQTYEQKQPQNRVFLKVGGRAIVFKGTNLKIRCPSKRINKTLILWYKDHHKIYPSRKFKVSRKGALRIRRIAAEDAGIYSCVAGTSKADIKIMVKQYSGIKSDEDKTVERPVVYPGSPDIMAGGGGTVEEDDYSHEHHRGGSKPQYEDNKSHYFNQGRTTNLNEPKDSTTPVHYSHEKAKPAKVIPISVSPIQDSADVAMSSETSDSKPYDTWENKHGGGLISDQQSEEINGGSVPRSTERMETLPPPTSGATSNHPIPSYSPIYRMFGILLNGMGHEADDSGSAESLSKIFTLGTGKPGDVKFSWMLSNWSECSQTCGQTGFQVRGSKCTVRLHNVTKDVDGSLCLDYGLPEPITKQKCGLQECPHWETGPWSKCSDSTCFTWNTAHQRREVKCRLPNGTDLEDARCDEKTRPRRRRDCYSDRCKGTWAVGEWSECTATCGAHSFQTRILQCVWYGTKKPAGNACRDQPRPTVLRPCKRPRCLPRDECVNRSKYCSLAKTLHMCRLAYYHQHCCKTCRDS